MTGVSKYWKEGENGEKGEPEELKGNNNGIYTVPALEDEAGDALHQTGEELPDGSRAGHVVVKGIGEDLINKYEDVTLQNAASANGNGTSIDVDGYDEILISITGTNVTTSTITFQALDINGAITTIGLAVRQSDGTMAGSTATPASATGEKWIVPIRGVVQLRTALTNLTGAGATVTVVGRMS